MSKRLTAPRIDIHATRDAGREGGHEPAAFFIVKNQNVGVPVVRMQHNTRKRLGSPDVDHALNCNNVR